MKTKKITRLWPLLLISGLSACVSLPKPVTSTSSATYDEQQMFNSYQELQGRLRYADWLLASKAAQRTKERQRLKRARTLAEQVDGAMLDSHPRESMSHRRAGLNRLKKLMPELGVDSQAFIRSWVMLGDILLAKDRRRDHKGQEIKRLRQQIEQLSTIDEQLNQRKQNEQLKE